MGGLSDVERPKETKEDSPIYNDAIEGMEDSEAVALAASPCPPESLRGTFTSSPSTAAMHANVNTNEVIAASCGQHALPSRYGTTPTALGGAPRGPAARLAM